MIFIILIIIFCFRIIGNLEIDDYKDSIIIGEITQISIFDSNGNKPMVFNDNNSIFIFNNIVSNLEKENKLTNLASVIYYIEVLYENGTKDSFQLFFGTKDTRSNLIKVNNKYVVYSIPLELNNKLNKLIKDKDI